VLAVLAGVVSDVNRTLGWLMVTSVFVVGCNLVADVLYGWLDPRIRSR
jgi:ABC-type dipeptide/oligopeptide/nickel transport system permease component